MKRLCVSIILSVGLAGSAIADEPAVTPTREFKFLGGMTSPVVSYESEKIVPFKGPTREEIDFESPLPPGSVIVKTGERRLYFIEPGGKAIRYAVGVGREGFEWSGTNNVTKKTAWPDWRPPADMISREAQNGHLIPTFVKGGPGNPLGARAIYIGDTEYRIHGTNLPWSIGQASSSGCIRMRNENVEELYDLVQLGARVVVENKIQKKRFTINAVLTKTRHA